MVVSLKIVYYLLIYKFIWQSVSPGGGGGGGVLNFCLPPPQKKYIYIYIYQEFQAPQKIFEILATQKISPIRYLALKKRP